MVAPLKRYDLRDGRKLMVDVKDAMVAIIGAAVALAGLLLIFSGFLFAQAAILPEATSDRYIDSFKTRALVGLGPFISALLVGIAALCFWWLPSLPYAHVVMIAFIVVVLVTAVYGVWAVRLLKGLHGAYDRNDSAVN